MRIGYVDRTNRVTCSSPDRGDPMHQQYDEYEISDDSSRLQLDVIAAFLARSYWAATRDRSTIERSVRNSIGFGAYLDGQQVAFARVVTDEAVVFWLCDVFVIEEHRGRG